MATQKQQGAGIKGGAVKKKRFSDAQWGMALERLQKLHKQGHEEGVLRRRITFTADKTDLS